MSRRFHLKQMLAEISEDGKIQRHRRQQLTQGEIRKLFADRRRKERGSRGSGQ
jgi:hypothetical protein